jgi:hypothetical protein
VVSGRPERRARLLRLSEVVLRSKQLRMRTTRLMIESRVGVGIVTVWPPCGS